MWGGILAVALTAAVTVLAGCGSSNNKTPATAQAVTSRALGTPAAAAAAATAFQAQAATPVTNPVERVSGTVQSVMGNTVSLKEGGTFAVSGQTAVTRRVSSTASALQTGQVVAITAQRRPDNSLLASIVVVFPAAPNGFALGQRPLDGGNLMTNATIEKVGGNGFTVTFPGGGAAVSLAPDAQIAVLTRGTPADITPGVSITASVRDGVAQMVSIQ